MNAIIFKRKYVIWVYVLLVLTSFPAFAEVEKFHGRAVNSAGDLLYYEEHTIRQVNGKIAAMETSYYNANLEKIGQLVSDFSAGAQFGSYDFKDDRAQYADGAKVLSDQILMYNKKSPDAERKEKLLERNGNQIVGQGFHPFIQDNLSNLANGDIISAKLVLPAQMNQFDVRIRKFKLEDSCLSVRVEMNNWFLRLFAPHIEVEYDINNRQLLSYKGVSVVADQSGKTVPVTVSYDYSQQNLYARFKEKSE